MLCSATVTTAGPWCSGPTCQPVTLEIAGSNPVGPATSSFHVHSAVPERASWHALCVVAPLILRTEEISMFGLGIVGTILLIIIILWLLGVIG